MLRVITKRSFDFVFAAIGLLFLAPFLLAVALLIKLSDKGPAFFLQHRVGKDGRLFKIWKFRTMIANAEQLGRSVTAGDDPRITRVGRWLRKTKCDELPQLWNVLRGEMSFVGPRPEVPRYVALYTSEQRKVLALKPGITDLATLEFRKEEELLSRAGDVESFYVRECIPRKIALNLLYARQANLWTDILLILKTLVPLRRSGDQDSRHFPLTHS